MDKLSQDKIKSSNYLLFKEDDVRKTGKFPLRVLTLWLRARMNFDCRSDLPQDYDPLKYDFASKWVSSHMTRRHLAFGRKTNKKQLSFFTVFIKFGIIISTAFSSLLIQRFHRLNQKAAGRKPKVLKKWKWPLIKVRPTGRLIYTCSEFFMYSSSVKTKSFFYYCLLLMFC